MLIAYHEGYLYLIKVCALFCVMVLAYSLFNHVTQGHRDIRQAKRTQKVKELLTEYADTDPKAQEMKQEMNRILRKPMGLLALMNALDDLGWTESTQIPNETRWMLSDLLTELYVTVYRKPEPYVHGMLLTLFIRCDISSSRIKARLLDYLEQPELLIRIEALRYICAQRNRKLVQLALIRISRKHIPFSNKLITDSLMDFKGDKHLLAEQLWENLGKFSPEIQVSVLQMLTAMEDPGHAQQVQAILQNEKTDMEVRIAAIKYFGSVHVPECVPVLAELLTEETWEYAAIAAKSLAAYDCSGVFAQLKKGISSRNWYVRTNCAGAIVRGCSAQQVREALDVADRYGRDSVQYALNMIQKEDAVV